MSSLGRIKKNIGKKQQAHAESRARSIFGISAMQQAVKDAHSYMGVVATTPAHPDKYPKHEVEAKGSVWRGLCNRTACQDFPASHYNIGTYGYYCAPCAAAINRSNKNPLCVAVDHSLSHAEMNDLYRGHKWTL